MSFTIKDLADRVRGLATEQPAARRECSYVYDDEPHCIVGCALHDLGVSLDALQAAEGTGVAEIAADWIGLDGTDDQLQARWLARVQWSQDNDWPWAEAVSIADEELADAADDRV